MKKPSIILACLLSQACTMHLHLPAATIAEPPPVVSPGTAPLSCSPESLKALPPDLKDCTCAGNDTWECTRKKKSRKEGLES